MPDSPRFPFVIAALSVMSLTGFALGWFCRLAGVPPVPTAPTASRGSPSAVTPTTVVAEAAPSFDAARTEPTTDYQRRFRLAQAAAAMDRAEVAAALEREHARRHLPDGDDHILPTEALLARFAEIDPAAATLWLAQTYPPEAIDAAWMDVALGTWATADQRAALAWMRGLPKGRLRDLASFHLSKQMAATDPTLTVQRYVELFGDSEDASFYNIFAALAARNLPAVRDAVSQLPPSVASSAVYAAMAVWTVTDPPAAYAWATQLPPGNLRTSAVQNFYSAWEEKDPPAAGAWLAAHGGAEVAAYAESIARLWALQDFPAARAWSEQLPPQARYRAVNALIGVWTESDPRSATDYVMTLPESTRLQSISMPVQAWATADHAAALAWMEQQPAGPLHDSALSAVCNAWSNQDPRACAEYLAQRSETDALSGVVGTWASEQPNEVWRWSQGLTDPKVRVVAASAALGVLAEADPAGASTLLDQLPAEARPDAAERLVSHWVEADPTAAARWASGLPEGDERTAVWASVVQQWSAYDAPAAAAWLGSQPPGEARDSTVSSLLSNLSTGLDTATAISLGQTLVDPDARAGAMESVATFWLGRDRAAATAWINQSPEFTDDKRAELLKPEAPDATPPVLRTAIVH